MARYKFDQIAHYLNEKRMPSEADRETYIGLEHLDSGSLTVTRWGSDVDIKGQKLVMHKGDILFGRRNTYLKRAAIAPHDGLFSAHGMIWRPKEDVVDAGFFPFFVSSDYFMDEAIRISVGSLSPTINWRDLKELEFDLPDIDTQRKLSTLLWAMERAKTAYKNLIARTDELVKSQFVEMIQPLLDTGNTIPLGELVETDRPITYGILKPGTGFPGGVPVVKVKDMKDGLIDQSDLLLTSPEIDNSYKRSRLRAGDLLISIRGSVGRMAEVPENLENANITQDTARLTIKKEYNKVYVRGVLESQPLQHDMEKNIRGVAVKGINIGYLRELGIPMCSRSKQDELAALYIQSDKSKFAAQQALADLTATQKALMRQYLG